MPVSALSKWRQLKYFGSVSVSRNMRYGTFGVASFGLRAGELHNLTPLFRFLRDQLAEISGRTRKHRAAEISDPRFHVLIAESRIDLLVQCVDDFGGRVPGCAEALHRSRFVA